MLKSYATIETLPEPVKGLCCSYYFQGNKVDESYIKQQLLAIDRLPCTIGLELIQIDAGYATWGDWLDTSKRFPSGMKSIVSEINKRGLKAGIWIAPFVASPHSKLFKEHPDWFVKDAQGRYVPARLTCPFDFLPKLVFRVLDITKPAVQRYIAEVINQFVEWGFEYIKTDFTYPICFSTNYELPMTRAQALRLGFEVINKASRGQAHIQSCISQLSPLVGLVDYARTGADTVNPYVCFLPFIRKQVNGLLLSSNLQNGEARQFLNGKIWINDADCLVCRPKTGLSTELIDRQFKFITNYQGSIWVGDNLINLRWNKYEKYLLELFGYQPRKKTAITVVVPAWNEEKTIQKTLDSLSRQQTKMPFEVILVDNNCTDNTVNVANTFQDRINHLRVVCETTQGIGAARNTGFDLASSDLIASTDADTNVPENWISEIYERFWGNEKSRCDCRDFYFLLKRSHL